jgi:hypothetical protein
MSQSDFTKPADRGERVPLSLVMPYAQAYIDRLGDGRDTDAPMLDRASLLAAHPEWASGNYPTPVLLLAERASLTPRTLYRWLLAKEGTIGYFDADAILTAVDDTGAWSTDPGLCAYRDMAADSLLQFDASEQEGLE